MKRLLALSCGGQKAMLGQSRPNRESLRQASDWLRLSCLLCVLITEAAAREHTSNGVRSLRFRTPPGAYASSSSGSVGDVAASTTPVQLAGENSSNVEKAAETTEARDTTQLSRPGPAFIESGTGGWSSEELSTLRRVTKAEERMALKVRSALGRMGLSNRLWPFNEEEEERGSGKESEVEDDDDQDVPEADRLDGGVKRPHRRKDQDSRQWFLALPKVFWAFLVAAFLLAGYVGCIPFVLQLAKKKTNAFLSG